MIQKPSRLLKFFHILVLLKPKRSLAFIFVVVLAVGYFAKDFRTDASSDSLTLEHDDDLRYYQKISERYQASEFVFITFTPKKGLLSESSLKTLRELRTELESIKRVSSVVTILDVPLLKNPPGPLSDLSKNIKTLDEKTASIELAKKEFSESPIYQNLLVSPDLRSTAIQVNFSEDEEHQKIIQRRSELKIKAYETDLDEVEKLELETLEVRHRLFKDLQREDRSQDVAKIRLIIDKYRDRAELFVGGVPMVIDDILSFIRNDLVYFGLGMILFLILALSVIFKGVRWVMLPMLSCMMSALAMVGLLGLLQWDITVVSSNFVSLQLIFTMSLSIHIVVRYRELLKNNPERENFRLVSDAVRLTFVPCAYASLTTIAGFTSLVICDILPVVNFGYMMTIGLVISLAITFWVIPAFLMVLGKPELKKETDFGLPLTRFFARMTENHGTVIIAISAIFVVLTGVGVRSLQVENSFIDYFKKTTDIYQGMKFIDDKLGGTTPLDIMIEFPEAKSSSKDTTKATSLSGDEDFSEFDEFEEEVVDRSKYWFTQSKFVTINRIHDYLQNLPATGKVMSLATLEKTVRDLNGGQALDNFTLALLFGEMPDSSKKILVDPYVSLEDSQARFSARIKDSLEGLRRKELIEQIKNDLKEKFELTEDRFRITGLMVLYNNMLQSLFNSQIKTIGFTVVALLIMFLILFRSPVVAVIAIFPSLLSALSALGVMGLLGIPLDIMTITIVAIGIGIAVDDTIHYLHRFKEELQKDGDDIQAMHRSHLSIGNAMYYTSLTITIGFSLLAISNFVPTILFGLLTALVMIMALVASLSLLPRLLIIFKPFKSK